MCARILARKVVNKNSHFTVFDTKLMENILIHFSFNKCRFADPTGEKHVIQNICEFQLAVLKLISSLSFICFTHKWHG